MAGTEVTSEKRLLRFLHYGSVTATYTPGSRSHTISQQNENIDALHKVLSEVDEKAFDIIKTVYKANTSPHPELIPFALAECTRVEGLKTKAIRTAEILCDDTKLFFLFFKFGMERDPKLGSSPTCRKLISSYYLKKDIMKLVSEVAMYPSYRGWRHGDLLCLSHIKAKEGDTAREAIFRYITRGAKQMKEDFQDKPEAKEVVEYLTKVHEFRKETDPSKVAQTIEIYSLSFEHVNFTHLKSKVVWSALLRQISLRTLLDHFSLIARNKLFRNGRAWDEAFITSVSDVLQNNQAIKKSKIHPSRVYLENLSYQLEARFKLDTGVKKHTHASQKYPAVSIDIVTRLSQLTTATMKLLEPTKLRYLISVDPFDLNVRKCGYVPYLTPSHAAAIIVQCYLKVEPNVTVVGPTFAGNISPIELAKDEKTTNIETTLSDLRNPNKSTAPGQKLPKRDFTQSMLGVFEWASSAKKKFDVIILIATSINSTNYVAKFNQYQRTMKVPRSKLVLISLCNAKATVDTKEIFIVSGFDDKVCSLVNSFVTEVF
ncbi:60 kDa SS-A Ro [Nesidiocoris tenuis]|uniref:60 kDa SS-A Ro n=1 Tax=Nesidiocoris tenuis TaxID=355587 RepID=A0ABN7ANY5_9HEMI|nr:60 kDa SS-A Ro [Nesidiocoris tenuis]